MITQDCLIGDHGKFVSLMTPAGKSKVHSGAVLQDIVDAHINFTFLIF